MGGLIREVFSMSENKARHGNPCQNRTKKKLSSSFLRTRAMLFLDQIINDSNEMMFMRKFFIFPI